MEVASLRCSYTKGGFMRRILVALIVACLLSATTVAPVFADGWGGHSHRGGYGFNPLWPVAAVVNAALFIPAAIIGTVAQLAVPGPVGYGYVSPPVSVEPRVYSGPETYNDPRTYSVPRTYFTPRTYSAPRTYYAPRTYSAPRSYYQPRVYVAPSDSYTPPYYVTR